jgi:hypothetical protein
MPYILHKISKGEVWIKDPSPDLRENCKDKTDKTMITLSKTSVHRKHTYEILNEAAVTRRLPF